ncbi:MAG TPA: ABC-F family ATP-binding cassette domain-containing protein [Bryobacteraceae bacterium]|nr:ABC-F family ATP-binding cassette domain-containing protein [Bryobacteraceae bacterium]
MSLISCQNISKTFGVRPLFENLSIVISEGERIGLIGPNGSGKSTLVAILAGVETPDDGIVASRKNLRLGFVPQESKFESGQTVRAVIAEALRDQTIDEYEVESRINIAAGRAGFDSMDSEAVTLSGGWKKRLAIARELVQEPDVLLLDEPTNHLDLDGILWLEKLLSSAGFASLIVSHDRYFLENVASDMIEMNRIYPEGIFRSKGNYSEFLLKRDDFIETQNKQRESLQNQVRREVEWLRRGPKARTTKSKARIDQAGRMITELAEMQSRIVSGSTQIDFSASGRKTKRLIHVEGLHKELGGRTLFQALNLNLAPGVRLGLVGPNGSGKTTLLRILAGQMEADAGLVERADNLRIVYFDQHREQLDPSQPLRVALCPHGDHVNFRDRPMHVVSWAKRFLFRSEQLDVAVDRLSGGERARVLIARLMLQPADVLMLDEPTNDLDINTLEVLEENLMDFTGSVVLVTHDRYMLDRVSTIVLGLDGEGNSGLFADYSQWEQFRTEMAKKPEAPVSAKPPAQAAATAQKKRLSYMEQREWDGIESLIHEAEAKLRKIQDDLHDPAVTTDPARLQETYAKLQPCQAEVDRLYERWAELEAKLS